MPDRGSDRNLASCAHCADAPGICAARGSAVAHAKRAGAPGAVHVAHARARIRRDRWRREQFFDAGFNVATVTVIGGVVLAVWMVMDSAGSPRSAATSSTC